jgi:hypothetical protein
LSSVAPESSTAALAADVPKEEEKKADEPVSTLSSAAPESSTAALAADVPKEKEKAGAPDESLPGAFPLTPPAATPGTEPQAFSVNPIPATEGAGNPVQLAPGEKVPDPSTLTSNTVQSTVKDDKEPEKPAEAEVSVAPIPATAGPGNPIHLAPGEKVPDPSTLTSNTVDSTAKTDAASYEKSDALPPQLDPVILTPEEEREAKGGMFSLPPVTGTLIPESSLPNDANTEAEKDSSAFIQSAAPTSTTAALAAQVPKEPRDVPGAVTESQKEADAPAEAAANPEAVQEKKEVEAELKDKVPEEPPAAESSGDAKETGGIAALATAAAGTFAAATYAAKDKAAEAMGLNGQATVTEKASEAVGLNGKATSSEVPEVVTESQKEAHASPEAAANQEAVHEKKEVEAELLKEVKPTDEAGEPAPTISAATTETAPAPTTTIAKEVPEVVAESQKEAHASPEAAANQEAVQEKKEVEAELLKEVKRTDEPAEPAPTLSAATTETAPVPTGAVSSQVPEVVADSQKEAQAAPEAAANAKAVEEKKEVESELLKEVKPTNETGEPAPTGNAVSSLVPEVVADSQKEAQASPEAAVNTKAVEEKKEVEAELLKEVKPKNEGGEPAPSATAATTDAAPAQPSESALNAPAEKPAQSEPAKPVADSRDVSPMTKQPTVEQTQPTVTTGTETGPADAKTEAKTAPAPQTDAKSAPEAPTAATASSSKDTPEASNGATGDKKKKRLSFFGKLKAKVLKH